MSEQDKKVFSPDYPLETEGGSLKDTPDVSARAHDLDALRKGLEEVAKGEGADAENARAQLKKLNEASESTRDGVSGVYEV